MEENTLLMPFFDDSPAFALGFECGQLWEKFQSGDVIENYLIHTKNIPQIKKIAETFLTEVEFEKGDEWSTFSAKKLEV